MQSLDSQSDHTELLTSLPAALAGASDREVLNVAAAALASIYPGLGYIRVLLVSQNYHPSQLLELCSDQRMGTLMAEASNVFSSTGSSSTMSTASDGGSYSSSQQAAMRQGMPVYTPLLQQQSEEGDGHAGPHDFTDWRVLQQQFGMHSFAAVPLMVAGTVHGVILAAAAAPHTFTPSSMHLIRTVANLLAPYAAVLYKYQQLQSTRSMLEQLLPARVVAAAIDRLSIGGNSLVSLFVPTHQDVQQAG